MELLSFPQKMKGYFDEMIILDGTDELLKYSLSNSLEDLRIAIYERIKQDIDLDKVSWKPNPILSISVKHLMHKYNVTFSMTIVEKENNNLYFERKIILNMRVGDKWFYSDFFELKSDNFEIDFGANDKFYSWFTIYEVMLDYYIQKENDPN